MSTVSLIKFGLRFKTITLYIKLVDTFMAQSIKSLAGGWIIRVWFPAGLSRPERPQGPVITDRAMQQQTREDGEVQF
jgi:hypothetical protein